MTTLIIVAVVVLIIFLFLFLWPKFRHWVNCDQRYETAIVLATVFVAVVAIPNLWIELNNLNVDLRSVQAGINTIFSGYKNETFCVKGVNATSTTVLSLKNEAIEMSLFIWEDGESVEPNAYRIMGREIQIYNKVIPNRIIANSPEKTTECTGSEIMVRYIPKP